jgi:helix-hairpin-helix protein
MLGNANGIDLNNAELYELERVGGLGRVLATRIIRHRPFRKWDDLLNIQGFDLELIKDLRGSGAKLGRVNPATAQKRTTRVLSISTGRRKPINTKSNAKRRGRTRTARNIFSGRGMSPD